MLRSLRVNVLFLLCLIVIFEDFSLASEQRLKVVTEDWKPYNYYDSTTKEVKGISTVIIKAVLNHAGIPFDIMVQPWTRSYSEALNKKNVLIYTIIRIPQREGLFKWVRPLGQGGFSSLYKLRKNKDLKIRSLKEAKAFKGNILVNTNSMDHLWLKAGGFKNLDVATRVKSTIVMLFAKRAPLIIFNSSNIHEEFASAGHSVDDVELVLPLFQTPPYMALSKKTDDAILHKIQKAYDELKSQGKIEMVD